MVQKFRKKPVVIEAMRVPQMPASIFAINMFHDWVELMKKEGLEDWMDDAEVTVSTEGLHISTLEGVMTASPGDWIIRGVKGEYYPCKPDIFEATYEVVTE